MGLAEQTMYGDGTNGQNTPRGQVRGEALERVPNQIIGWLKDDTQSEFHKK